MQNLGLSNNTGGNNKIVQIIDGYFRIKTFEGNDKAVTRTLQKGKNAGSLVYELIYKDLTGYITDIQLVDFEFGKQANFFIKADKEYNFSIGYSDGIASNLYKMLPNIDPSKPVTLSVNKQMGTDGKLRTSIFATQGIRPVKWAYTKDNPNGMPPFEKIVVKGKEQWDNTKQVEWLIENSVKPFVEKAKSITIPEIDSFDTQEVKQDYNQDVDTHFSNTGKFQTDKQAQENEDYYNDLALNF